jgi:adenosylcobinamide hydrolase
MAHDPVLCRAGEPSRPVLVWHLEQPMIAIASAPHGGGIGRRHWIVNAQVAADYARTDVEAHLGQIATELGCVGTGVGLLTAAPVEQVTRAAADGVAVFATVGLQHPAWAAAPADADGSTAVGTINVVAFLPVRLTDAALVNAVTTVTEAKSQALVERGVPGTGTASDAVCVLTPDAGPAELFGGPRSIVGAPLARAVHHAIAEGVARQ